MAPESTGWKQAGRFRPGQSGNLAGRPRGARNATTLACEALLDGEAQRLTAKCIQMALEGDPVALKLCFDRIYPPRKGRTVTFPLRAIDCAQDTADALSDIAAAVASGQISPEEGSAISAVLGHAARAYEVSRATPGHEIRQYTDAELHGIIEREEQRRAREETRLLTDGR
ncbi:hypothetical protein FXB40_44720 [Bradyrhizobium rifense]|uniref:DUF5681 domain-containing protein n=1 Tax=Bradyrhizobium rifense TaxID=515499 RepID=A0A5D3K0M4_9BRAD|nr:DUF5681 domain-containing protein [Bradyrhizobium rifense]TYL84507.1 hypothetical protein FXB40_44720 [Bradyrhizobium rifense]